MRDLLLHVLSALIGVAVAVASGQTQPAAASPPRAFSVRQFGALGDGEHNDAPAIQAAIDALASARRGKLVFEPFRTYRLSRPIACRGLVGIEIDGQNARLKPLDHVTVATAAGDTLVLANCGDVTVHDLTFEGNRASRGPAVSENPMAIRIFGCSDFVISDCNFRDAVCDDVYVQAVNPHSPATASKYGRVTGCTFDGAYRSSVSVIGGALLRFDHNIFRNCRGTPPQCGIDIEPNSGDADGIAHDIDIESNTFVNCGNAVGVRDVSRPRRIVISGNRINGCQYGIITEGVLCVIRDNQLEGCGISAESSDGAVIEGNTIHGGTIYADTNRITHPAPHIIRGNTIVDSAAAQFPISTRYAAAVVLDGNVVHLTVPDRGRKALELSGRESLGTNWQFGIGAADGIISK